MRILRMSTSRRISFQHWQEVPSFFPIPKLEVSHLYSTLFVMFPCFPLWVNCLLHWTLIRQVPSLSPVNHIQSVCSTSNPSNWYPQQFLDTQYIPLSIHGKVVKVFGAWNVLRPTRHGFVNHLNFWHGFQAGWHGIQDLSIVFVGPSNFHLCKSSEYIQLRQVESRESIDECRVIHLRDIKPSNPSRTTSRCSV